MFWVSRKNRLPLTIALILGLVVIGTILATSHGPKPSANATYSGNVDVQASSGKSVATLPIKFKINAAANRVEDFRFPGGLPRLCLGMTVGKLGSGGAPIVTPSRFIIRLPIERGGSRVGTLLVSGTFHEINREEGALRSTFTAAGLRSCGANGGYTANAVGKI